ncbi:hypothetical protein BDU57DRAFT_285874 [Ampelomyces quisqualis]|uniref:Uncharacterized protein n=1 Tax=Ampelomyces quisqualis TaxID=50730 RepID=A0A6A5QEX7_AMPQU|nr:hypothetical protein BDU57DRAFT_285874 [Ampelomyces quisqualis]
MHVFAQIRPWAVLTTPSAHSARAPQTLYAPDDSETSHCLRSRSAAVLYHSNTWRDLCTPPSRHVPSTAVQSREMMGWDVDDTERDRARSTEHYRLLCIPRAKARRQARKDFTPMSRNQRPVAFVCFSVLLVLRFASRWSRSIRLFTSSESESARVRGMGSGAPKCWAKHGGLESRDDASVRVVCVRLEHVLTGQGENNATATTNRVPLCSTW